MILSFLLLDVFNGLISVLNLSVRPINCFILNFSYLVDRIVFTKEELLHYWTFLQGCIIESNISEETQPFEKDHNLRYDLTGPKVKTLLSEQFVVMHFTICIYCFVCVYRLGAKPNKFLFK